MQAHALKCTQLAVVFEKGYRCGFFFSERNYNLTSQMIRISAKQYVRQWSKPNTTYGIVSESLSQHAIGHRNFVSACYFHKH